MNSMTGFGAATAPLNGASLRLEISSVNRKQAEVVVTLPRAWAELETRVRESVASRISRGRISVSLNLQAQETERPLTLHRDKLKALTDCIEDVRTLADEAPPLTLDALLRLGIIAEETEADLTADEVWAAVGPALDRAMQSFLAMRAREGAHLRTELLTRVDTLRELRRQIIAQASGVVARHRDTMLKRLEESGLPLSLDDERLIKEIALFADKCDISEEISRLESHLNQFESLCDSPEAVGRTLDFMCQEIFRELNTTGSKANDAGLARLVVTAKTELEKIREQVQNIE